MYPTVSSCPLLCGQFTWSNLLVSRKYLLCVSGGVQRGASARANRGLETAGSGSRNGKRNLWKAEHSKVFRLPFNAHPERKFPIRFFITSKVIDEMSWKIDEFVGVLQAVSVENCPKRVRSNVKCQMSWCVYQPHYLRRCNGKSVRIRPCFCNWQSHY